MRFNVKMSESRGTSLRIFAALSLLGIITGTVIVCVNKDIRTLNRLVFTNNIFSGGEQSFFTAFCRTFLPLLIILAIQFFSGFFAFGQVFAVFTAAYRGAVSGISASMAYLASGAAGIFAVGFRILPLSLLSAAIVILGAREAVRMSWRLAEFSFFGSADVKCPDAGMYLARFGVLGLSGAAVSFLCVLLNYFL